MNRNAFLKMNIFICILAFFAPFPNELDNYFAHLKISNKNKPCIKLRIELSIDLRHGKFEK